MRIRLITLTPLMFGETRPVTPYFQQMIIRSKIPKIIQSAPKKEWSVKLSVNYFENFGTKCHLLKIGCSESNFTKHRGCQYKLPMRFHSLKHSHKSTSSYSCNKPKRNHISCTCLLFLWHLRDYTWPWPSFLLLSELPLQLYFIHNLCCLGCFLAYK